MTKAAYEQLKRDAHHLALDIGVRPAARAMGLPEGRLLKWSHREHWNVCLIRPQSITNAKPWRDEVNKSLANALESKGIADTLEVKTRLLAQYGDRTKIGLARSACTASETLAEYPGKAILNAQTAIAMEQVSRTADRVHGWSAERAKPLVQIANVTLPSAAEREDREKAHRALDDIARALRLRD